MMKFCLYLFILTLVISFSNSCFEQERLTVVHGEYYFIMIMDKEDSLVVYNADIDFIYKDMPKDIFSSSFKTDSNGLAFLDFVANGYASFNENIRLTVIKEGYKTQKKYYNTDTLVEYDEYDSVLSPIDLPARYFDMATIYKDSYNYSLCGEFFLLPPIYLEKE